MILDLSDIEQYSFDIAQRLHRESSLMPCEPERATQRHKNLLAGLKTQAAPELHQVGVEIGFVKADLRLLPTLNPKRRLHPVLPSLGRPGSVRPRHVSCAVL